MIHKHHTVAAAEGRQLQSPLLQQDFPPGRAAAAAEQAGDLQASTTAHICTTHTTSKYLITDRVWGCVVEFWQLGRGDKSQIG